MEFLNNLMSQIGVPETGAGGSSDISQSLINIGDILNIGGNNNNDENGSSNWMDSLFGDADGSDRSSSNNPFLNIDNPVFQFAISDIERSNDTCALLDDIEEDINGLMKLFDPESFFATTTNTQNDYTNNNNDGAEGLNNLFEGMGEFFTKAIDVVSNTISTVVNVMSHTSPRCTDAEDADLREVFSDFAKCTNVELTVEELESAMTMPVINMGLKCINQLFPEISASGDRSRSRNLMLAEKPSSFCAATDENLSTSSQLLGLDSECTTGILGQNAVGKLFRMMLVTPDTSCSCMSILDRLPECRTSFTTGGFVDAGRLKKYKCLIDSSVCPFFASACTDRLEALDTCLPSLDKFHNTNADNRIDCKDVMCSCEAVDNNQSINYAAELMKLPLTDMCQKEAESSTDSALSTYDDVPRRYELLRSMCGYIDEDIMGNFYQEGLQQQQLEQQPEMQLVTPDKGEEQPMEPQEFPTATTGPIVIEPSAVEEDNMEPVSVVSLESYEMASGTNTTAFLLFGLIFAVLLIFAVIAVFVVCAVCKNKKSTRNNNNIKQREQAPVDDIDIIKPCNTGENSDLFTDDESSKVSVVTGITVETP